MDTEWPCRPSCAASPAPLSFCSSEGSVRRHQGGETSGLFLCYGTKKPLQVGNAQLYWNVTAFLIEDSVLLHAFLGLDFKDTLLLLRREGQLHRVAAHVSKTRYKFTFVKQSNSFTHWAVCAANTWKHSRGQLKVTCETLTAAWLILFTDICVWGRYFFMGRLPPSVCGTLAGYWVLLMFEFWACLCRSVGPVCVCWLRANHLLIMSPWLRGHHAVHGEKCVTRHCSQPHNLSCTQMH